MNRVSHFHACSPDGIRAIAPRLLEDVEAVLRMLPRRGTEAETLQDLFWLFTHKGFCHERAPVGSPDECPFDLDILEALVNLDDYRTRDLCLASAAFDAHWRADLGKRFGGRVVQVKSRFGEVDGLYKDFCGFRIGHVEGRLALGIEIVAVDPGSLFDTEEPSHGERADFAGARAILTALDLVLPIWLIGIEPG